jgi:hypothetical protein
LTRWRRCQPSSGFACNERRDHEQRHDREQLRGCRWRAPRYGRRSLDDRCAAIEAKARTRSERLTARATGRVAQRCTAFDAEAPSARCATSRTTGFELSIRLLGHRCRWSTTAERRHSRVSVVAG